MSRASWSDLKRLRARGQRPQLPVIVTDRARDVYGAFAGPFLVIVHQAGTPFPVEALRGLDCVLMLDCAKATAIARMFRDRDVKPQRFRSWCDCAKMLTCMPERSCTERDSWPDG